MTLIAKIRQRQLDPLIRDAEKVYQTAVINIQEYQLAKFQRLWCSIQKSVPYYQQLVQTGAMPAEIQGWEDFAHFPILTRTAIQKDVGPFVDSLQKITGWSVTSGSTGTPLRVPKSSEIKALSSNTWLGRKAYGIQPSDRMFRIWGHAHLFGSGWKRPINRAKRKIKNKLLGYEDFSAYALSLPRLRAAGTAIVEMRPDYVVGYSGALALLAAANEYQGHVLKALPIKAIIATSETFKDPDDAKAIEQIFGCPLAMEYGAAETGVIAYTDPCDHWYRVFWDSYLLEAVPISESQAKLLVTALYPRVMPLIRYEIGDCVQNFRCAQNSVIEFDMIAGRNSDFIEIDEETLIHPLLFSSCIKTQNGVLGYQVVQEQDKTLTINIMCEKPLSKQSEMEIRRKLSSVSNLLANCDFNYVDQLEQSSAGKTRTVIVK